MRGHGRLCIAGVTWHGPRYRAGGARTPCPPRAALREAALPHWPQCWSRETAYGNRTESRAADDVVFTSRSGRPLHKGAFSTRRAEELMLALVAEGLPPFRFHDLRRPARPRSRPCGNAEQTGGYLTPSVW